MIEHEKDIREVCRKGLSGSIKTLQCVVFMLMKLRMENLHERCFLLEHIDRLLGLCDILLPRIAAKPCRLNIKHLILYFVHVMLKASRVPQLPEASVLGNLTSLGRRIK